MLLTVVFHPGEARKRDDELKKSGFTSNSVDGKQLHVPYHVRVAIVFGKQ